MALTRAVARGEISPDDAAREALYNPPIRWRLRYRLSRAWFWFTMLPLLVRRWWSRPAFDLNGFFEKMRLVIANTCCQSCGKPWDTTPRGGYSPLCPGCVFPATRWPDPPQNVLPPRPLPTSVAGHGRKVLR